MPLLLEKGDRQGLCPLSMEAKKKKKIPTNLYPLVLGPLPPFSRS